MSEWSKIPPAAPGFWWMRDRAGESRVVHVVDRGGLRIALPGVEDDCAPDAMSFREMEWRGPLPQPASWARGEPAVRGWYWITDANTATVVYLFRPWSDDPGLWVATTGRRSQPLRRAGLGGCDWAGPLTPQGS
jgi:hypothetical protein